MSLWVARPGTFSLVVDAGRPGTRRLGVPVGGPADRTAMALGNALVGNPPFAPALEVTLTGPALVASVDVGMCVFGAPFRVRRHGDLIEPGHTFTLRAGQTLDIGGTPDRCRAYVCVVGGFTVPPVLGSATAFAPVRDGDELPCVTSRLAGRSIAFAPPAVGRLRCLPGPQADWFDDAFFRTTYRVTPASNRMGVRLDGPPLTMPKRELVSEPVAPGAVQVTNEGKPIVLGVDGQTIGGYPKAAHVIDADLDRLGQLRPGDEVTFTRVSEEEAEAAGAAVRAELGRWWRRLAL
jgi:5-oxoprolinase (ATP-hydrolysing) subunit C